MNKVLKSLPFFVSGILIFSILFVSGFTSKKTDIITDVYKVYLDGDLVGIIKNEDELNKYIDQKQEDLKNKYKVSSVYAPEGLEIRPFRTYTSEIDSVKKVYNEIKDKKPFTIGGYTVTFKLDDKTNQIYVLDKEIFKKAIEKAISTFIDEEEYELYLENMQVEIKETGKIIEDIHLQEDITIKESLISVENNIFTNQEDLTKYLLFGTTEQQKTYTVKQGDTISAVAFNNQLNPVEFLIANPDFTSEDNLLYEGQEVVIGLINPQFHLVVQEHVVEDKIKKYTEDIKYDDTMLVGTGYELQKGENGLDRVTQKIQYVNGQITSVVPVSQIELQPVINSIYVRGGKIVPSIGDTSSWYWPTLQGYTISSGYGWRWGALHRGTDIAGVGHGSPIFATNNGTVYKTGYTGELGNYVYINHNNGYYSAYLHLSKILVTEGQVVERSQKIGLMGNTGNSRGTHLHFEIWTDGPPYRGGVSHDPMTYFR